MYNESSKKATIKYMRENLEEVRFRVKKGEKARYKEYAKSKGKSLASLIVELLESEMSHDSNGSRSE